MGPYRDRGRPRAGHRGRRGGGRLRARAGAGPRSPAGAVAPFVTATLPDPLFSGAGRHPRLRRDRIHPARHGGADNADCPDTTDPHRFGGTVDAQQRRRSSMPCNTVIQMPANTMTWADFVNGGPSLALTVPPVTRPSRSARSATSSAAQRIAGLLFASQQSANTGTGVITAIDYATGNIEGRHRRPGQPGDRADQRPERPLRPRPEPRRAVQRRRREPDRSTPAPATRCACRAPTRPRRTTRCARRTTGPTCAVTVNGARPRRRLPQLQRRGRRAAHERRADAARRRPGLLQRVRDAERRRPRRRPTPTRASRPRSRSATTSPSPARSMHAAERRLHLRAHRSRRTSASTRSPAPSPATWRSASSGSARADPNATAINGVAAGDPGPDLPRGRDDRRQDRRSTSTSWTSTRRPAPSGTAGSRPFEMTGENASSRRRTRRRRHHHAEHRRPAAARPAAGDQGADRAAQPAHAHHPGRRPARCACRRRRSTTQPATPCCRPRHLPATTRRTVANGLKAGQYSAPTFEFIFPENVKPGDLVVPYDLWHLPFLRYGEGATRRPAWARSSRRRGARRSRTCRRCPHPPRPAPAGGAAPAVAAAGAPRRLPPLAAAGAGARPWRPPARGRLLP